MAEYPPAPPLAALALPSQLSVCELVEACEANELDTVAPGLITPALWRGVEVLCKMNYEGGQLRETGYAGLEERVVACLQAGADPNDVLEVTKSGVTPLHAAAQEGHAGVVAALLAYGADAGAVDKDGNSALHDAAFCGKAPVVVLLLSGQLKQEGEGGSRAMLAAKNAAGRTALHLAALNGGAEAAKQLLGAGASKDAEDGGGLTPLALAQTAWFNWSTIRILQK